MDLICSNFLKVFIWTCIALSLSAASSSEDVNVVITKLVDFFPTLPSQSSLPTPTTQGVQAPILDHLEFTQVPKQLHQDLPVHLQYRCSQTSNLHISIVISTEFQENVTISRERLRCSPGPSAGVTRPPDGLGPTSGLADSPNMTRSVVRLKLPRYAAYQPSFYNRYSVYLENAHIRVWMTRVGEAETFNPSKNGQTSLEAPLLVTPPFSRPPRPVISCPTWLREMESKMPYNPTSLSEIEIFKGITYPMDSPGGRTGVHRQLLSYRNKVLQKFQERTLNDPRYTFVFWLYLTEHCPAGLCSILKHMTWDDRYATPLIFINEKGQVHIEVITERGESRAYLSPETFTLPLHQWVRLTVACYKRDLLRLFIHYGENYSIEQRCRIVLRDEDVQYFDDRVGNLIFGGSELQPAFRGYMGQAWLYRRRVMDPDKIPNPDASHPMYRLNLKENSALCNEYGNHLSNMIQHYQDVLKAVISNRMCENIGKHHIFPPSSLDKDSVCPYVRRLPMVSPQSPRLAIIDSFKPWIRKSVLNGDWITNSHIGSKLLYKAVLQIEKSAFTNIDSSIEMLKAAGCLEAHNATFILSVILNYGLGVQINESEAGPYLIRCAQRENRLCLLALANKHAFGLDGFPFDQEQAYVYFKHVADLTKFDRDAHQPDGVYTELIRLTNEYQMNEHSEETGDLFTWFKFQANLGVTNAQQQIARMLYWGSHGINRNVDAAAEYYRMGADAGDPDALYDYGIVLIKGHGVEKNITHGIEMMRKAAEFNHPQAINAIGWYYLEIELNYTQAVEYFERAHELGNKDAAHNLAHMYLRGYYPGSGVDRVKAWDYISVGARRGQIDCGIMVAMYNMRGHPSISRNADIAVTWARFISEQNPAVGQILNNGLRNYKRENWMASLFYYLLAASLGVEVGNFNLAYLIDESQDYLAASIGKECKWRHYNLSIQRPQDFTDSYAVIRMADYFYSGAGGTKNLTKSVELNVLANQLGDPQGLYNLAYLMEEGVRLDQSTSEILNIYPPVEQDNITLPMLLYSRCLESVREEAFLPCSLALYRIYISYMWNSHQLLITIVLTVFLVSIITTLIMSPGQMEPPNRQTRESTGTTTDTDTDTHTNNETNRDIETDRDSDNNTNIEENSDLQRQTNTQE